MINAEDTAPAVTMSVREAGKNDIDQLVRMRFELFRDAGTLPRDTDTELVEKNIRAYFERSLGANFRCLVAEDGTGIIATAACTVYEKPPNALNPTGREGYIVNVYTRPEKRMQGVASELVRELLARLKADGITRVRLHATPQGYYAYMKMGFVPTKNEMEIFI